MGEKLLKEAEINLEKLGSINIMVFDETFQDWQVWRPLIKTLGSRNDLALKTYAKILELSKKRMSTRDLATLLNEPYYSINKVCNDLKKIGLIDVERQVKGPIVINYWRPKKRVLGILRLIPSKYFEKGKIPRLKM